MTTAADLLLERDTIMRALHDACATTLENGGRIALVCGEAGIDKTVVVRRLEHEAQVDMRICHGVWDALFTPRPLGPLYDLACEVGGPLARLLERRRSRRVAALSPHHVSAILRRLGVRTRGEAAAEALRLGVVDER